MRALLEKWSWELLAFLDPKNSGFGTLLEKVKEFLESNESRRVPKPPKVMSKKHLCVLEYISKLSLFEFCLPYGLDAHDKGA